MTLIKWDPFESLSTLQTDIEKIFDRHRAPLEAENKRAYADWLPAVDIHEDKEGFHFDVEAPGLEKNDIKVNVENGVLSIRGERRQKEERRDKNFYRVERSYGSFFRSFQLPDAADSEHVGAEYKDGVLKISIPKLETAKPRQIEVKVN